MVDLEKLIDGSCRYAYNLNVIRTQPKRDLDANPTDRHADIPATRTITLTTTI